MISNHYTAEDICVRAYVGLNQGLHDLVEYGTSRKNALSHIRSTKMNPFVLPGWKEQI